MIKVVIPMKLIDIKKCVAVYSLKLHSCFYILLDLSSLRV